MSDAALPREPAERPRGRQRRLTVVQSLPHERPSTGAPPDQAHTDPADAGRRRVQPTHARGVLLAVCGVCGGAGASTLTYLIGAYASRRLGPVIVLDTGGPTGGLAACAGVSAARSLSEIVELVAAGLPTGRPYVTGKNGLRVLAAGPRLHDGGSPDAVRTVLSHAREAHSLSVIDCGTLAREADRLALSHATHVAWVVPATRRGAAGAARVLEAVSPSMAARQLLVARRDEREPKTPMRALSSLARQIAGPLILLPHLAGLTGSDPTPDVDAAQVSLQAILGQLER